MDEIRYIRDVAVTIAAVLLIISMVHYDKGLYLGLPISNDKNATYYRGGFYVKANNYDSIKVNIDSIQDSIDVWHKNSCVNGYNFR